MVQYSDFDRIIEAQDNFKNRAGLKSQTSRIKFKKNKLLIGTMCVLLSLLAVNTFGQPTTNEYAKLEVIDCPQSFAELLKKFEDRVVFISFMATWCRPCIAALKETKKLESYFKENNIVKLFISMDFRIEAIDNAIKIIQNDSLSGYFVSWLPKNELCTSSFQQDISNLFFKSEDGKIHISIPRYAIVNRKGELVEQGLESLRPSNPTSLKKQLKKHL